MSANIHISLAAEPLFHIGPFPFYNSYLSSLVIMLLLIFIALKIKKTGYDLKSKLYNFAEMAVDGILNFLEGITGNRNFAKEIFPWIFTFFIFILLNNWFGLVPFVGTLGLKQSEGHAGNNMHTEESHTKLAESSHSEETAKSEVTHEKSAKNKEEDINEIEKEEHSSSLHILRATNSDLNMTLALALISVILTQYLGFKKLGFKGYGSKFLNFANPILFFVGILEIISEIVKIFSFSFRLFGNMFAGEVLLAVIFARVPLVAPIPFYGVEFFAGFIQALIFSMLTAVFINIAVSHH